MFMILQNDRVSQKFFGLTMSIHKNIIIYLTTMANNSNYRNFTFLAKNFTEENDGNFNLTES